jgi:hypothetical protein
MRASIHVLAAATVLGVADARACAPIELYPIRPDTPLYAFPSYTRQLVTAANPNLWSFAMLGQSGVTHFQGRIRDASGGALNVYTSDPGIAITRPSADEIDYTLTYDSSVNGQAVHFEFTSASPRVVFEPLNDSVFSQTVYPKPDNNTGLIPARTPFALTLEATGGRVFDPAILYCDGFE